MAQENQDILDRIITKGTNLYTRFCNVPVSSSDSGEFYLLNNNDLAIQKNAISDINSFIDDILLASDQRLLLYNLSSRTGPTYSDNICVIPQNPLCKKFKRVPGNRNRVRNTCSVLSIIPGTTLKTFIPQLYHILQDHGFFHMLLGITPTNQVIPQNETSAAREIRLSNAKQDIHNTIIEKIQTLKLIASMSGASPQHVYKASLNYIEEMRKMLNRVHFLRQLDTVCCSRSNSTPHQGHVDFEIHLGDLFETIRDIEFSERRRNSGNNSVCGDSHIGDCVF